MTSSSPPKPSESPPGHVVLLHGLGLNSWTMWLLGKRLRRHGYVVHNWGYGSIRQSFEWLIPHFERRFLALQAALPPGTPLHIVGHSMGSILARAIVATVDLPSLGRVVMLTPPNAGSHVATSLGARLRWLTRLVEELSDREDSHVNRLPRQLRVDVGVIAADRDHLVREVSTHLDCESDHIIVPSRHTELVFRRQVAEQIAHFLSCGQFLRNDSPGGVSLAGTEDQSTVTDLLPDPQAETFNEIPHR